MHVFVIFCACDLKMPILGQQTSIRHPKSEKLWSKTRFSWQGQGCKRPNCNILQLIKTYLDSYFNKTLLFAMFYVLKMLRFVKFSRKQYDESANGAVFACSFERAVAV